MIEFRIIIAGGRNFDNYNLLESYVEYIIDRFYKKENVVIISGTAKGADKMGEYYAAKHNIKCCKFPANWDKYGKQAGPIRNKEMAQYAVSDNSKGVLIAFWDKKSKGTENMIQNAKKLSMDIHIYPI